MPIPPPEDADLQVYVVSAYRLGENGRVSYAVFELFAEHGAAREHARSLQRRSDLWYDVRIKLTAVRGSAQLLGDE